MNNELVFLHGGRAGDCIWHLPCMISLAARKGFSKFTLLLKENIPVGDRLNHPCGKVCMNKRMIESLITLLEVQPYIESVRIWRGEQGIDFDKFRWQNFDFSRGDIGTWPTMVYMCNPDFTRPWLDVGIVNRNDKVLVSRSTRYRNDSVSYNSLKGAWFVGLHGENDTGLPSVEPTTILDLAKVIESSRLFVGNQSLGSAIAAGLDHPRVLEVCPQVPNVMAHTPRCTLVWNQSQLLEAVGEL